MCVCGLTRSRETWFCANETANRHSLEETTKKEESPNIFSPKVFLLERERVQSTTSVDVSETFCTTGIYVQSMSYMDGIFFLGGGERFVLCDANRATFLGKKKIWLAFIITTNITTTTNNNNNRTMTTTTVTKRESNPTRTTRSRLSQTFLIGLFVMVLSLLSSYPNVVTAASSSWTSTNLVSFAAGGVGGICSVLIGHPFDLIKVRQQTGIMKKQQQQQQTKKRSSPQTTTTTSTFGILKDLVQTEGIGGIYRGVSAPLIAVAPIWAVSFWGFDTGDTLVRWLTSRITSTTMSRTAPLSLTQLCLAGGFSALPTALVMVPCERIKCLLQTQSQQSGRQRQRRGGPHYQGFGDCASQLLKQSGIAGLYKGTALTLMRDIPGNMVYFAVYEVTRRYLLHHHTTIHPGMAALMAGAMAGVSFWPVILPMDCCKSKYQTAPEGTYTSMGQVYRDVMETDGVAGMFAGIKPAMIRSAPANAVSFLGAEMTKSALGKYL